MTTYGQRPISVHLDERAATIECGACTSSVTIATADRIQLVQRVRLFLQEHNTCRYGGELRLTAERMP
jgi:hypothetical protein